MKENLFMPDCIRTASGIYMNVFEPTLDMICIEDIAHALSQIPRFGGHLCCYYSVAHHSLYCCGIIKNYNHKLEALLHDASEAYLMDIPSPIKKRLTNYYEIEDKLMKVISEKFKFEYPLPQDVKDVDAEVLQLEWDGLMVNRDSSEFSLSSSVMENNFLKSFNYYKR